MNRRIVAVLFSMLAMIAFAASPGQASASWQARHADLTLNGQGSTFDAPLFSQAFVAYNAKHPVQVNYQANGSGAGQIGLNSKTSDFGCFDVPMLASDNFSNFGKIAQFPVALGGASMVFNLPDYSSGLKLSGDVIAKIYLGQITKWTDSALTADNPGLASLSGSEANITVVHRSDSSGTSYMFTDFLSRTNSDWASHYGPSKLPAWPVGQGGKGSSSVAAIVQATPGAIGYVESSYALQNHLSQSFIKNKAGQYVIPFVSSIGADASKFPKITPTNFSIVDGPGKKSYPIASYSWCGVYQSGGDWGIRKNCRPTVQLFQWETTKGEENFGPPLDYVKLPKKVRTFSTKQLASVHC